MESIERAGSSIASPSSAITSVTLGANGSSGFECPKCHRIMPYDTLLIEIDRTVCNRYLSCLCFIWGCCCPTGVRRVKYVKCTRCDTQFEVARFITDG